MAYRCVLTAALLLSAASSVASTNIQSVPSGYQEVALQHGAPGESLYPLAMAESSRKLPHRTRSWPWTFNLPDKGYRYDSRQATVAVRQICTQEKLCLLINLSCQCKFSYRSRAQHQPYIAEFFLPAAINNVGGETKLITSPYYFWL